MQPTALVHEAYLRLVGDQQFDHRGHFFGDLGYLLVIFLPADSTTGQEGPVGTYRTVAHLIGLTLGVTWP